jgi:hypothetical protein
MSTEVGSSYRVAQSFGRLLSLFWHSLAQTALSGFLLARLSFPLAVILGRRSTLLGQSALWQATLYRRSSYWPPSFLFMISCCVYSCQQFFVSLSIGVQFGHHFFLVGFPIVPQFIQQEFHHLMHIHFVAV